MVESHSVSIQSSIQQMLSENIFFKICRVREISFYLKYLMEWQSLFEVF